MGFRQRLLTSIVPQRWADGIKAGSSFLDVALQ